MYVEIPPKVSVSEVLSDINGNSTFWLFDRHPEYDRRNPGRHFWARSYYVATVGNVNE